MRTAVFSIVSPNYRHYARVLMESVQDVHPEWERFVLIVGTAPPSDREELFTPLSLSDLALPHPRQFTFRYTLLELNTAVKPWAFAALFARGYDRVVYLDPDIRVYSRLEELESAAPETFLTLTPHLTGFIGGDDHPSERAVLQAGTYNLGFLEVRRQPQLAAFLNWWQEKLEFQCVVDINRGLFVDQKWIDLAPGLFAGVSILRHDGYNVAYWNLRQRAVAAGETGTRVNGQPLRFFHFSGVDLSNRRMVSKYDTLRLDESGAAAGLISDYQKALVDAGSAAGRSAPYEFATFRDGTPLPDAARVAYRTFPELQAKCGEDPFAHPEHFTGFRAQKRRSSLVANASRASYRLLSGARPLVKLLPAPLRRKARELLLGRHVSPPVAPGDHVALAAGMNIAGYVSRPTGVGESARLCRASAEAGGIPTNVIDLDASLHAERRTLYPISVFHVNADQVPAVHAQIPEIFADSSYRIGVWHWELPELPDEWIASAAVLDEIWAPSAFIQSAVSRKVPVPVVHLPHGVDVTAIEPCDLRELDVPAGRFTFLCMFDLASVMQRKNPAGALQAFRRAFANDSRVALLIKANDAEKHPAEFAELQRLVSELPNVHLTSTVLSRARTNGLIAACDGVVSLHRSEGFGLILAEAMALGKPVVATAWSGNMDFMNATNSCPVDYELVTLDRDYASYRAGQRWAEPDLDHAASCMRRLVDDDAYRVRISSQARRTIEEDFSPAAAGARYRARLRLLRASKRG